MGGTKKHFTYQINVSGIVQGVGFRPFIYKLAKQQKLYGYVLNDSEGVKIHLQCNSNEMNKFCKQMKIAAPPRSIIQKVDINNYLSSKEFIDFSIHFSNHTNSKTTQISPDLGLCEDCMQELFDRNNRRYLYPFINCTNCGPRFTITRSIPYDRKNTTMGNFEMCPECISEYENPLNRRFHAQPNGCHSCGPKIELTHKNGNAIISGNDSGSVNKLFSQAIEILNNHKILAIKGIGGFHLVCDATSEQAVSVLRNRKYREDKPFAVMFDNISAIEKYCDIIPIEKILLQDFKHPIVLLKKKGLELARSIAPTNQFLGVILPYTPVHHLLMRYSQKPLVMTSGNISDEPIKYSNQEALKHLSDIADYFLINNRSINIRCDDSVIRNHNNKPYIIRRSRGYAPANLDIDYSFKKAILACGAEQKNLFALAKQQNIYLSHHIGDLKNYEVLNSFVSGVEHFKKIFAVEPEIIAVDKHPQYLSTIHGKKIAESQKLKLVEVQHHHAHAVSAMIENNINEKAIALTMDGTGYGEDGKIWGGECMVCDYTSYKRIGCFREVKLPGGDNAIKDIGIMGLAYLHEIFGDSVAGLKLPFIKHLKNTSLIFQMLKKNQQMPVTTSCGRLFDGVAAICGLKNKVNYEGQAAIEFEQKIIDKTDAYYPISINRIKNIYVLDWEPMFIEIISDIMKNVPIGIISCKFHNSLVEVFVKFTRIIRTKYKISKVVLSGGVFMNMFLLKKLESKLLIDNFTVYTHSKVPTNDGGIALGHLIIADNFTR